MCINKQESDSEISLRLLYGDDETILELQRKRYTLLKEKFESIFNLSPSYFFSSPGRTEISGNHTDHNHGKVIAASINLDSIAAVSLNNSNEVVIYSEGFTELFSVDLNKLKLHQEEKQTTHALIRGIAAGIKRNGYKTGGFNACIASHVIIGSGLSSSASIEILIGTIFNYLFNDGKIPAEKIALIGQYAENNYFGKPCGLMDQLACITGGIIGIDFKNPLNPKITKIGFDFLSTGYKLIVVDTKASHSDLTDEYAAIPKEMKEVAGYFSKEFSSEISLDDLVQNMKLLREKVSDRAILRAIHFLEENRRVELQIEMLNKNDFNGFLKLVNKSGDSSYKYLQNVYSTKNTFKQEVSLALALSEIFIKDKGKGACRVHGGGFAGTILVFLPDELIEEYKNYISKIFNRDSVKVLTIRNLGAVRLSNI